MATSLSEGEAIPKCVGLLKITHNKEFRVDTIKLQTVRPFIFNEICVTEFQLKDIKKDINEQVPKSILLWNQFTSCPSVEHMSISLFSPF